MLTLLLLPLASRWRAPLRPNGALSTLLRLTRVRRAARQRLQLAVVLLRFQHDAFQHRFHRGANHGLARAACEPRAATCSFGAAAAWHHGHWFACGLCRLLLVMHRLHVPFHLIWRCPNHLYACFAHM